MPSISIQTTHPVIPMIYAYTTPGYAPHDGWTKIGYTDKQSVEDRVKQQVHTADIAAKINWRGSAVFDDGSGDTFTDHDFRAYLRKLGVEIKDKTEWCHIEPTPAKARFFEYRSNRGVVEDEDCSEVTPYTLREEQARCARDTADYSRSHPNGAFLWNCKPRFGKTLTTYDFIQQVKAEKVLIVTNRPAIANSWYQDYEKFVGREAHYIFVSSVDGIKDKPLVMSYEAYEEDRKRRASGLFDADPMGLIDFVSLQDMKGGIDFGGDHPKLQELARIQWDVLVIDEAHEGVDTYRTDVAFDHIRRKFTLHLSGTPFKALANDKFPADAIFNWTYADEQRAKRDWKGEESNPYERLPRLNMFTYQMSEIVRDQLAHGIEIDGETEEYAFDLNEFFATNGAGRFVHEESVDRFLEALTTKEKFPFSTPELRDELRHTFWLLNRVDSARALMKKLQAHPVFSQYEIVLAAGDGRMSEDDERAVADAFNRVNQAIKNHEYTITLSVGQLTTGVTIPQWTAVLMLSSIRSPALYMQAAFRAQNPCMFYRNGQYLQKQNAYVFDFDPARTLIIFEKFANDLSANTADGRGDMEQRKANVHTLLNFFPVIGEDEEGKMIGLDAEKVLSIPRRIKSREVVNSGFQNNYLFIDAIGIVFRAPQEIMDIIGNFTPVKEAAQKETIPPYVADKLSLNAEGDVELDDEYVIGVSADMFGKKIFDTAADAVEAVAVPPAKPITPEDRAETIKKALREKTLDHILETAKSAYGANMRASSERTLKKQLGGAIDRVVDKAVTEHAITEKKLQQECRDMLDSAVTEEDRQSVQELYEEQMQAAEATLMETLQQSVHEFIAEAQREVVNTVETDKREREKKSLEDKVKDRLRGFSRTIPSFLMAYGDEGVTLANFDAVIPADVFREVTSITLEQFRKLRDGGEYVDEATGETNTYPGLFDPVVFDDSIRLFLQKRSDLADYFEEDQKEDIFDYIPPQKTNQIFTPKWVVKKMVDMLEEENPGCFDQDDKTFADLYMKSGLYIAEIVKRLYQSDAMKEKYPRREDRLRHIFAKQVYGLAPTEIIYRIAMRFVLGFAEDVKITEHHLRQLDALEYAKNGTLKTELDRVFSD